jgi:hypothetical protein
MPTKNKLPLTHPPTINDQHFSPLCKYLAILHTSAFIALCEKESVSVGPA